MDLVFAPSEIETWPIDQLRPYTLAVATQIRVFQWFGLQESFCENLALGGVFTGISLLRSKRDLQTQSFYAIPSDFMLRCRATELTFATCAS